MTLSLHARRLGEASNTRDSSSQQCGPCTAESCQLQAYYDAGKDMAKQFIFWAVRKEHMGAAMSNQVHNVYNALKGTLQTHGGSTKAREFVMDIDDPSKLTAGKFNTTGHNRQDINTLCTMETHLQIQVCPGLGGEADTDANRAKCKFCTNGNALANHTSKLLTDDPKCDTWFLKADAVTRGTLSALRTVWLNDRINVCKMEPLNDCSP